MDLKVIKEDEKTLIVEAKGESTTITNLISKELWNDSSVSEAANIKEHPYLGEPKILVKTNRGSPRVALEKSTTRLLDQTSEFREEFKRAMKK